MAGPGIIQVPPDSTGKKVDAVSMDDGGASVYRQKMVVTGGSGTAEVVAVMTTTPTGAVAGLVTRQAGPIDVNAHAISGTATVSGLIGLTAGTSNIGFINNISATVTVAGVVGLTTGTANIGRINDISATVTVAGNVNISATATVAGTLNISGSVVVSGVVNVFAMGEVPSASRGPRTILASTSANVTMVAAPGANLCIYVTGLVLTNASGTNARARVGPSASIGQVTVMMAQSGGGAVINFVPPWQVSANEALLCSVKPNVSEGIFNVHYFVASADAA